MNMLRQMHRVEHWCRCDVDGYLRSIRGSSPFVVSADQMPADRRQIRMEREQRLVAVRHPCSP
jgi:hypothetical protein